MEGLNLKDLEFDENSLGLFDGETGLQDNKPDDKGESTPPDSTEGAQTETTKNTDSEEPKASESVANQNEDNQVQAGKTANSDEGSDSSSPKLNETEQLYSNLAAEFKTKGVLPELDTDKIKSLEDIEEAIRARIESELTDEQKLIKEAKKVGAPVDEVSSKIALIDKLKSITPEYIQDHENVEFRRTAIIQDALSKGYSQERAAIMAQRSIDAGTDIEDAEYAVSSVIKAEEDSLNDIIEDARELEKDSLDEIRSYIDNTKQIIPGIEFNSEQNNQLFEQMTTDLGDNQNKFVQAQKEDPLGSRIKMEAIFYLTDGFKDFSVFGAGKETKITNNIETLLRGASFTSEGKIETKVDDPNSNFLSDLKDHEIE